MQVVKVLESAYQVLISFLESVGWLMSPLSLPWGLSITPIMFISFYALISYLGIAITKWFIS